MEVFGGVPEFLHAMGYGPPTHGRTAPEKAAALRAALRHAALAPVLHELAALATGEEFAVAGPVGKRPAKPTGLCHMADPADKAHNPGCTKGWCCGRDCYRDNGTIRRNSDPGERGQPCSSCRTFYTVTDR